MFTAWVTTVPIKKIRIPFLILVTVSVSLGIFVLLVASNVSSGNIDDASGDLLPNNLSVEDGVLGISVNANNDDIFQLAEESQGDDDDHVIASPQTIPQPYNDTSRRTIYFFETTGVSRISIRQACSIESASRANPDMNIRVMLVTDVIYTTSPHMSCVIKRPNVRLETLDLENVFLNSPLEQWYRSDFLRKTPFRAVSISDALRTLILWKNGGIYLDLDMIVMRSLVDLRNAIGLEYTNMFLSIINNAALVFDKHHSFLELCLEEFNKDQNPNAWGPYGMFLMTRLLTTACHMTIYPTTCLDVMVLPQDAFYPADPVAYLWRMLAPCQDKNAVLDMYNSSYGVHLWNSGYKYLNIVKGIGQGVDILAETYCPCVHSTIGPVGTIY